LRSLGLAALVAVTVPAGAADALPSPVARALDAAGVPASAAALYLQEVGGKRPRLSINASRPMNPASVMKLVTTYAALELLGPAYTWRTEAWALTLPADGELAGDLYLRGSGDPKLVFEQFWLLLRELRARGVAHIRGDLVLDRSRFAPAPHDPGAFDGEPLAAYNVGADALLLNYKALRLKLIPEDRQVAVVPEPLPADLEILNLLKPATGPCGDWKDTVRPDLTLREAKARLVLTGVFPSACGERVLNVAVLDHPQFVLGVFRQLWQELGGRFEGAVRDAPVPAGALPLAAVESPALAEAVRDTNKFSNNVMARQLLLTLGAERSAVPASEVQGAAAVRAWLGQKGLEFPELVIENGSGLSRSERISAEHLGQLLLAAWRSPVMPEFIASLPVAATDGTMKRRLNGQGTAGRAHVKTGSLDGVRTLAGYLLDREGRRWVVVFLVNHSQAGGAVRAAQDALLEWIHGGGPG
jgi:D-alanyl-D-alanine carboxypeptidase/D-alanyl-D-alanine-endopeptidase (penicillin-binding protein 4)